MTMHELLTMPVGVLPDEWEKELKRRKNVEKRIRKLSDEIDGEVESLEVLWDELGSERWHRHNNRLYNLIAKRDRLLKEMDGWA